MSHVFLICSFVCCWAAEGAGCAAKSVHAADFKLVLILHPFPLSHPLTYLYSLSHPHTYSQVLSKANAGIFRFFLNGIVFLLFGSERSRTASAVGACSVPTAAYTVPHTVPPLHMHCTSLHCSPLLLPILSEIIVAFAGAMVLVRPLQVTLIVLPTRRQKRHRRVLRRRFVAIAADCSWLHL